MGYTNFSKDRFSKDNFTKINFIKTGGRNMCDKFIGRKNELKSLETAYSKNSFQMCIVYGRRRIGKTTLINEFIRGKEHIAFTAIKGSAERNIELFGEVVVDYFMPGINGVRFTDIKDILNFITNNIGDKKLVLVIDELPYLAEADKEFLSLLQVEIDKNWLNKNIFLILSGSSISFMEQEVLSSKSPIYGRRQIETENKARHTARRQSPPERQRRHAFRWYARQPDSDIQRATPCQPERKAKRAVATNENGMKIRKYVVKSGEKCDICTGF